jgi:acetyl-CoA carboxylase biotin carboxyl carrier protein
VAETYTVKSPLPGIFYRRPSPEALPYVEEGQHVKAGQTIGLVEVMKSFHEVPADKAGVALRFLVEDEQPVQIGQDLLALGQ